MALTVSAETDLTGFTRSMDRFRQALAAPISDDAGIGGGIQAAVYIYAGAMRARYRDAAAGDGTWKPLKPQTIARKRKLTSWPERILYLTGTLYSSLQPGEPGSVFESERDRVRYGTSIYYARYHQNGGGRLPRRSILTPPTQELIERCTAPIVAAWQKVIDGSTQRIAA